MKYLSSTVVVVLLMASWLCPFRPVAAQTPAVSQDEVLIGLNIPLSGSYKAQGRDQERAYRLAIDRINSRGGVLGKKIRFIIKDTKTNAAVAARNAEELIRKEGAVMLTGGSSSAVAVAQADVCQKYSRIFMAALTHSNATTGHMTTPAGHIVQKAHRHTFRWFFNAWMTGKALVPYLNGTFGDGVSYYYITADYTWGHTLEDSMRWGTEISGGDTAGSTLTPLGQSDFRPQLTQALRADAQVLVLILFGNDMVTALKQAHEMGLSRRMKIVVPLMELNMAHQVGHNVMQGVISTVNWYWGLQDRYPGSREFVSAFVQRYRRPPGSSAACAWVAIHEWAAAVERAGSFASGRVIKALEDHTFTLLKGKEKWRAWDHQAISSVYVVKGKSRKQAKDEWDLLQVVREQPGRKVMRSRENNPVSLEPIPEE